MSWTAVNLTFDQEYQDDRSSQAGTRIYLVVSDTVVATNDLVLSATDGVTTIPAKGSAWSVTRSTLTADRRRVTELGRSRKFFQVRVDYSTPTGTGTAGSDDPDPTARPWVISSSTLKTETNIEKTKLSVIGSGLGDIELGLNKSIVTAASDPLEVRGFKRQTIITLSKNYAGFTSINAAITNLSQLKAYEGQLNNAVTTIASIAGAKWTFLIDEINVSNALENEISYINVNYRIIYNPETHIEILLNAGLNQITSVGPPIVFGRIKDSKGQPVTKPRMLAADGSAIPPTNPGTAVATGTYIAAGINPEIAYTNLSLPTAFN